MHFLKIGKTYQLRVDGADALDDVLALDESLWVATSAPNTAFRCDPGLVTYLDSDANGRIYTNEIKQAVRWLRAALSDFSGLGSADSVSSGALNAQTDVGKKLATTVRFVLDTLQLDGDTVQLTDVRRLLAERQKQALNGDGVLVPEAADTDGLRKLLTDIIACTGGVDDSSGQKGVNAGLLKQFCDDVDGYSAWITEGKLLDGTEASKVKPYGDRTEAMHDLLTKHAATVDHFFELCLLKQFGHGDSLLKDETPAPALNDATAVHEYLMRLPLAAPNTDAVLPLAAADINPAYRTWIAEMSSTVLAPILGQSGDVLAHEDWQRVKSALAPFAAYAGSRKGARVAGLSEDDLKRYRVPELRDAAAALIQTDHNVASLLNGVRDLEKLLLYQRHLLRLLNNFVNFTQLYATDERALFELGSVVLDGRWFNFAVAVADMNKHAEIARSSNIFTLYLEVTGSKGSVPFTIAVPATSGAKGNLVVGKQGVFFDIGGTEYDARVVKIIENPISIREALIAPFIRLWEFVIGKIEKMSGSSEKELQKSTDALIAAPAAAGGAPAMNSGNLLMGLSISAAALGSAFAFITKTLTDMGRYRAICGLLGAAAAVGVPVFLIAFLKLRRQDLSSLLEGCGWAINMRMRPNHAQRRQFTRTSPFPLDATGTPGRRWGLWLTAAIVAAIMVWLVAGWLGNAVG